MLSNSEPAATEAYRVLRTNLQFASVDRPIRTLLITSPAPGEGKTLTAANLAVALAQAGRRVILVDADLRKPRLHHVFKLPNHDGLTTALVQERPDFDGLLQAGPEPGLFILTSGPLPPNPSELLGSGRTRDLVAHLLTQAEMVLFDSPPAAAVADAVVLGAQLDSVLVVLDAGRTRRDAARRTLEALRKVNARVAGAALNRMPRRQEGYYYDYYQRAAAVSGASDGDGRLRGRKHKRATQAPTSAAPQG